MNSAVNELHNAALFMSKYTLETYKAFMKSVIFLYNKHFTCKAFADSYGSHIAAVLSKVKLLLLSISFKVAKVSSYLLKTPEPAVVLVAIKSWDLEQWVHTGFPAGMYSRCHGL